MTKPPAISDEAIVRLAQGGLSSTTIATLFDLSVDDVDSTLSAGGIERDVPAVSDIQSAMRALALRIIEETMVMIDEAAPAVKIRLLSNMFSRMIPLVTQEDSSTMDELRAEMLEMFTDAKVKATSGEEEGSGDSDEPAGNPG